MTRGVDTLLKHHTTLALYNFLLYEYISYRGCANFWVGNDREWNKYCCRNLMWKINFIKYARLH